MISDLSRAFGKSCNYLNTALRRDKTPLAYVGGWLGQSNLGDEALYLAAQRLFDRCRLLHYDGRRTLATLLEYVPLIRFGALAGGTLINRSREWFDIAESFQTAGGELLVMGTGVAHPEFWSRYNDFIDTRAAWIPVLRRCAYVGVRGPLSAQLLSDAGLQTVDVIGDPALIFAERTACDNWIPNSLGLNLGQARQWQWGTDEQLRVEFTKLAQFASTQGWAVRWYVVWADDYETTRMAARESGTESEIVCIYDDPEAYLRDVRRMSVFVGMKLHASMLAMCAYVPLIAVEYQPKCKDFMASVDQESFMLRSDAFRAEEAWELVKKLSHERTQHSEVLFRSVNKLKSKQVAKAKDLCSLIGQRGPI